jgi:hypothetical protein
MARSTRNLRIAAVVFAVLGASGLAVAAFNVPRTSRLLMGARTEGEVVGFQRVGRGRHLVVRFVGPDGDSVEFRSQVDRPRDARVGDYVPVRYDPHDPAVAEVDSFHAIWGRVVIPAAAGLVLGTMALLIFLRVTLERARRRRKRTAQHPEHASLRSSP